MILKLCNNGQSVVGIREDGAIVSHSIEAEEYKQWLSEGNIPEPEFTTLELAQQTKDKLKQYALLAIENTDSVYLRCGKAGVVFPTVWQAYTIALRAIISGTDTTSIVLPTMPSYPAGT